MLRRSDKRKDRVEISPEQLSSASTQAEISFQHFFSQIHTGELEFTILQREENKPVVLNTLLIIKRCFAQSKNANISYICR